VRLALIADKNSHKLNAGAYSQSFYDMFKALVARFGPETFVVFNDCKASQIDADVIIIFDLHSSHNIEIKGLRHHPALKMTYFNDVHQQDFKGQYKDGSPCIKRGAEARAERSVDRGIDFFIVNDRGGYRRYIAPYLGANAEKRMLFFPAVPAVERFTDRIISLVERRCEVLANGATWSGGLSCYDFRGWAYNRMNIKFVKHCIQDSRTPKGVDYANFLSQFAGSLALCDWYAVSKYFEIPLAGCVSFMQDNPGCSGLGFEDGVNAVFVNKANFDDKIEHFLRHTEDYQGIADAGRRLVEDKYTAEHFADFIYKFAEERVKAKARC